MVTPSSSQPRQSVGSPSDTAETASWRAGGMGRQWALQTFGLSRLGRAIMSLCVLVVMVAMLVITSSPAHADDQTASDYTVNGTVNQDGSMHVSQVLSFDGDTMPQQITQRLATTKDGMDYTVYHYEISDIAASSQGTELSTEVSDDGDYKVITVNTDQASEGTVQIDYTVAGAAEETAAVHDQDPVTTVDWRILQGLSVGVAQVEGQITIDSDVPAYVVDVDCKSGAPAAPTTCSTIQGGTFDQPTPRFTNGPLGAGQIVNVIFQIPSSVVSTNQVVTQRWTLDRAFSTRPLPLAVGLAALILGGLGLWQLHRRRGTDQIGANRSATVIAEWKATGPGEVSFTLVQDVRPGEVGTLLTERVDPVDITATVLDLAIRGHLMITEIPRDNPHKPLDWQLERRHGSDELRPYEAELLDAIVPPDSKPLLVSSIAPTVSKVIDPVQDRLYDNVVAKGWFARRPDATRDQWTIAGWVSLGVSLVAFVLLLAFTSFALLGLSLVVLAVALLYVAQRMPRRTAAGAAVIQGLNLLSMQLQTQDTKTIPTATAYDEISRVLPFAVVLGGFERWLDALAAADQDPDVPDPEDLDWYHAPNDWYMADLPDSLRAFVTTMQGLLFGRG